MRCPVCNMENDDTLNFCQGCGRPIYHCPGCGKVLTNQDPFCDNCGTPIPNDLLAKIPGYFSAAKESTIGATEVLSETNQPPVFAPRTAAASSPRAFCENCGKRCMAGSRYCTKCEEILFAEAQKESPRKQSGLVIVLLVLLLVAFFVGGFIAIKSGWIELPALSDLFTVNDAAYDEDEDADVDEDEEEEEPADTDPEETEELSEPETENPSDDAQAVPDEQPTEASSEEITEPETEEETTEATEETVEETTEAGIDLSDPVLYFIENCDKMYFDMEDLAGFSKSDARYARNGCYAKSGRMFNDASLQAYYEQFDWYVPSISPNNFSNSMMNAYQIANLNLVLEYESKMGY